MTTELPHPAEGPVILPRNFRKLPIEQRRKILEESGRFEEEELSSTYVSPSILDLAEAMTESAIGTMPVPLGITGPFIINGVSYHIPMATEEPSVIAAATFGASIISHHGGFTTWATEPIMIAQIYMEDVPPGYERSIDVHRERIMADIDRFLSKLKARGGGVRKIEYLRLPETQLLRVHLHVDVRDAMGANIINSAAESIKGELERVTGGSCLMCILTNDVRERRAGASFIIPVRGLTRGASTAIDGEEAARRIMLASRLAQEDSARAVTHNKGVMNGISALALATGNDVRGIEAGVHLWAARDGSYRGVSTYEANGGNLEGKIEVPLAFATVGGATSIHPAGRFSLKLLGSPDSRTLSGIAAALGLAQNFAAVSALVTEGIQSGHMRLHAERLAFQAGATKDEIPLVAERLFIEKTFNSEGARRLLETLRMKR